jgi:t-SNARE complex subunit (syntaxin)
LTEVRDAEAMDYIVDDRGEKINKIEKIMGNIHDLAKDIAVKVDE